MTRLCSIARALVLFPLALILTPLAFFDKWLDDRGRRGPKGWRWR
jgi:hypothetical protein